MKIAQGLSGPREKGATARAPSPGFPSHDAIAQAAYFRAQQRGFVPGNELADWLAAERELSRHPAKA
jgi:hypothetical protein